MAPIRFLQLLFEERHLLFRGELVCRKVFDRRNRILRRRFRGICGCRWLAEIAGFLIHDTHTLLDPVAFFQFTYISSTFDRAHGVRRRNVRLDLTLGS